MNFKMASQSLALQLSSNLRCALRSAIAVLILVLPAALAAKQLDRPVAQYDLQCSETFACPESLMPRVAFWIEVFSRWDTNTAVFHDKDHPERVFSTVSREQGCRRSRKGDAVDRERKRLKKVLRSTAAKIESGSALNAQGEYLKKLFAGASARDMRKAADRIRCQSGNQDRMYQALKQFQLYRPTILDALESENLTSELQYLPFVESAFNPEALSHVGAAGLWQIMPSTGRSLGLTVNSVVDQRYDPGPASYAAARYFRNSVDDLSETAFENGFDVIAKELNPFVITSYNYGVKGMERAIKQVGLDYQRLLREYKSPNFQTAVKNFYASFLAARHVAKNAESFFGVIEADQQQRIHSFNTVTLSRATSAKRLAKGLGLDQGLLKKMNPALKKIVWRDKALVPKGFQLRIPYREAGWNQEFARINKLPREIERPGYVWHRVKRGQTACGIAERYRASCRALRKLNRLDRQATIYVGQRLKVPSRNGGISVAGSGAAQSTGSGQGSHASVSQYRVKRGDTACTIANGHGMKCAEFLAVNGLTRSSVLQIGQRVTVSAANSWHIVKRGQTACGIAERYRVSCSALLDANRLRRASTILVGQRLRIPHRT